MPKFIIPSLQSKTFSSNGTWTPPLIRIPVSGAPQYFVTNVVVIASSTGASFGGTGSITPHLERNFSVTANTSYSIVVGAGTVTLYWLGVRDVQ